jgi:hypothetical protein
MKNVVWLERKRAQPSATLAGGRKTARWESGTGWNYHVEVISSTSIQSPWSNSFSNFFKDLLRNNFSIRRA